MRNYKYFKCLFFISLIFNIVFLMDFSVAIVNAESIRSGDFGYEIEYTVYDEKATIMEYYGTDPNVVIPAEIDGKKVTRVARFSNNDTIKHLTIEEGITELGREAFKNCNNLETVSLPEGIIELPDCLFENCSSLYSVNIPSSVEVISRAFKNCTSLSNITLSASLKTFTMPFDGCYNLVSIDIDPDNEIYSSEDGVLYNKDMTGLMYFPYGKDNVEIPKSVKWIFPFAFSDSNNLTSIVIPGSIKTIPNNCFTGCVNLKRVEIENGVETLEMCAFFGCSGLNEIRIPDSVTNIHKRAFADCYNLVIYANPNSYAKSYADNERIQFKCLEHSWDKGVITVAPTLQKSGTKIFTCKICMETKTETIPKLQAPKIGSTVTKSDNSYKVVSVGTTNATVQYSKPKKSKTTITIPDTVKIDGITYKITSISKNAFKNNKKIKKVIIGKNITKIEANAFSGCKNLKTITVKSTKLKSVGKNAFKGINKKAKIKVPKSKLKKYKNLMSKKGQKSTVKITK